MRIISGTARGTKLYSLEGMNTRPTLDRVKESLFNMINFKLQDAYVLDLFAGSGAIGLEALSRGASKVFFCDKSREAINIINKNIEKTRFQEKSVVLNEDFLKVLEKAKREEIKFDLIFLDPPYETDYIKKSIEIILKNELLKENGLLIAETDEEKRIIEELKDFENINVEDIRKYGRVYLIFINRKG